MIGRMILRGMGRSGRTSRIGAEGPRAPRLSYARRRERVCTAGAALTTLALLAGCGSLESTAPVEPITDPTRLYQRLVLNHAAVNLATDPSVPAAHALQLVATPYNAAGAPIAGVPAATFTLLGTDTLPLTVTSGGLIQARQATNGIKVLAELTLDGVKHADTAIVNITSAAPPPTLDTFSLQVPADSAVWYVSGGFITDIVVDFVAAFPPFVPLIPRRGLSLREVDATGTPVSSLQVEYLSLDPAAAQVDRRTGAVTVIGAGYAHMVARTFAYGVAKEDTMTYTVQPPFTADILIDQQGFFGNASFRTAAPTLEIVAGGIVTWHHLTAATMDITFDDPTNVVQPPTAFCDVASAFGGPEACGAGNAAAFTGDSLNIFAGWRSRQFPLPGTYPFRSTTNGAQGRIIVHERTPLP